MSDIRRLPPVPVFVLLVAGLLGSALLGLWIGPFELSIAQVWDALWRREEADFLAEFVVHDLRLPRVLLAGIVGAALAVAGAILQGLFRNPLADPGLIGVSAGAALGAVAVLVIGERVASASGWEMPAWALPIAAFSGALLITMTIWRIASRDGVTRVALLLLVGIAMNAIAGAITGLLTFMADDVQRMTLSFWSLGSLAHATWTDLAVTAPWLVLLLAAMIWLARPLNALLLGEAVAGHLGYPVHRIKQAAVVCSALAVGAAVSVSGLIGFVGLVAPHLIRLVVGVDHRWVLAGSALLGAQLLILADLGARMFVAPAELPIGLVTALIGGPVFLALLLWRRPE